MSGHTYVEGDGEFPVRVSRWRSLERVARRWVEIRRVAASEHGSVSPTQLRMAERELEEAVRGLRP